MSPLLQHVLRSPVAPAKRTIGWLRRVLEHRQSVFDRRHVCCAPGAGRMRAPIAGDLEAPELGPRLTARRRPRASAAAALR